jgi:hypothetical protein
MDIVFSNSYTERSLFTLWRSPLSQFVSDCPRCKSQHIAFDVLSSLVIGVEAGWLYQWEIFCMCGNCKRSTVFIVRTIDFERRNLPDGGLVGIRGAINPYVHELGYISLKDKAATPAPEFLPPNVLAAFNEGARCLAVDCFNAAGTMFRLCVDMASADKLPKEDVDGLTKPIRRSLGLRLQWLFDNRYLPEDLRELSHCVKEDGNDGAHQGTLTKDDALDLLDFTVELLERFYTQPEKVRLAGERRAQRRSA